jgi:hypothetical protein
VGWRGTRDAQKLESTTAVDTASTIVTRRICHGDMVVALAPIRNRWVRGMLRHPHHAARYSAAELEHLSPDALRGAGTKKADVPNLRERQIRRSEIDAFDRRRAEMSQEI